MSVTSSSQTLVASELAAIRTFLQFQGTFNNARIVGLTNADIGDYYGWLGNLSANYGAVQNAQWQGWYAQLFATLTATTDFAQMYLVWQYSGWVAANPISPPPSDVESQDTWHNYWYAFRHDYWWNTWWTGTDIHALWGPGIGIPGAPPSWQGAVQGVADQWGDTPPANLINAGLQMGDNQQVVTSAQSILNGWKAFPSIVQKTIAIGQAQHTTMTTLLQQGALTADTYFFLLHLLLALPSGDASAQQLALKIVGATASSPEYPNDTFINQLVYLALLYLADPLGSYGWNNAQLQGALQALEGAILATDPASAAIKSSLVQHGKILNSDASYPMQDPYTSIGFSQRKTDTLFALDKARQGLNQ